MKKYFVYELKKNAFAIGCIALIAVALYAVVILSSPTLLRGASETYIWIVSTEGGLLAAFVPVWLLNYGMKKQSADLYYSLPLSRTKILAVRFLVGLIAVFAPYTVAYLAGAFCAMARAFGEMNAVFYVPQYFASLIPVYLIYSVSAFVFTRANSVADGIIFIAFWTFAVALVALFLQLATMQNVADENGVYYYYNIRNFVKAEYYTLFAPLDFVTAHFEQHIAAYMNIHAQKLSTVDVANIAVGFSITALLSAGATAGLFLTEKRKKAENASQISESFFGYKTMLPLYAVFLSGVCSSFILYVLIIACAFFLTVAYKRTFKIGKVQAAVFAASAVAGLILCIIMT